MSTQKNTSKIDTVDFSQLTFGKVFTDHMISASYNDKTWAKAELLDYGPIALSPSISVLHYGQSVFEGMKAFYTKKGELLVFRPKDHLQRLNRSLDRMAMPRLDEAFFLQALENLLRADREWAKRAGQLYLRPFVFATEPFLGVKVSDQYTFMILACPVPPVYYMKPLDLKIETEYSRASQGGVGFAKAAGNYAASMYPTRLAQEAGFDQLIWTDSATHQTIEESGTMNIMCVIDDVLVTPPLGQTILAGLTRDSVLTIAKKLGIKAEERPIGVAELAEGLGNGKVSEVFGVGTAVTIAKVASITYQNKKYELDLQKPDSIAVRLYDELEGIKRAEKQDSEGWMYTIR